MASLGTLPGRRLLGREAAEADLARRRQLIEQRNQLAAAVRLIYTLDAASIPAVRLIVTGKRQA